MRTKGSDEESVNKTMQIKPIGIVRNGMKDPARRNWKDVVSEIVIDDRWTEALDNIDEFSHITVLFWMHESAAKGEPPIKVHPQHNPDLPRVGLFASRSPRRPNPIGKSLVRLLERRTNVLKVQGLDAIDGTPVIDIKPYIPGYDSVDGEVRVPSWLNQTRDTS